MNAGWNIPLKITISMSINLCISLNTEAWSWTGWYTVRKLQEVKTAWLMIYYATAGFTEPVWGACDLYTRVPSAYAIEITDRALWRNHTYDKCKLRLTVKTFKGYEETRQKGIQSTKRITGLLELDWSSSSSILIPSYKTLSKNEKVI